LSSLLDEIPLDILIFQQDNVTDYSFPANPVKQEVFPPFGTGCAS
jgi:hypothetical protein